MAGLLAVGAAACSVKPQQEEATAAPPTSPCSCPSAPIRILRPTYTKKLRGEVQHRLHLPDHHPTLARPEKRQIALASGDYPDLFLLVPWVDQFNQAEIMKFGQQGVAIPLNDLIEEYAPNVQKALDNHPDYGPWPRPGRQDLRPAAVDDCFHAAFGEGVDKQRGSRSSASQKPKTTAELAKVLIAFKNEDPNGNGRTDEIPLGGDTTDAFIPYFMNAFTYDPQNPEGYLDDSAEQGQGRHPGRQGRMAGWPGLRQGALERGVIDRGAFTQNPEALHLKAPCRRTSSAARAAITRTSS